MVSPKSKNEIIEEVIAKLDYELIEKNTLIINGILDKLDKRPVYPVTNSSITIYADDDKPVNVIRLTRPQFTAIAKHAVMIEMNDFNLQNSLRQTQNFLWFSRMLITLEDQFGPSDDQGTDDGYKSSFYFPFLLQFPNDKDNHGYLMIVHDIRGSVNYEFAKIISCDESVDRNKMHNPFEDFTGEEMKYAINFFNGYLKGYFYSHTGISFDHFFYKTISSDLIVYGYDDGKFFDYEYDDPDEYNEVVKYLSSKE